MDMTPQEYQEYVKHLAPKSPIFKDTAFAFFIGGAICALGQLCLLYTSPSPRDTR